MEILFADQTGTYKLVPHNSPHNHTCDNCAFYESRYLKNPTGKMNVVCPSIRINDLVSNLLCTLEDTDRIFERVGK